MFSKFKPSGAFLLCLPDGGHTKCRGILICGWLLGGGIFQTLVVYANSAKMRNHSDAMQNYDM